MNHAPCTVSHYMGRTSIVKANSSDNLIPALDFIIRCTLLYQRIGWYCVIPRFGGNFLKMKRTSEEGRISTNCKELTESGHPQNI